MKKHIANISIFIMIIANVSAQQLEWAFGLNQFNPTNTAYFPSNTVEDMILSSNQDIYVCGGLHGNTDFDPSTGMAFVPEQDVPAYIAKYDSAGNYLWHIVFEDSTANAWDFVKSMDVDANGDLFVAGYFTGNIDFDPSANTYYMQSQGSRNPFFGKYSSSGQLIWVKSFGDSSYLDRPHSIRLNHLGNLFLAGQFIDTLNIDPGSSNQIIRSNGSYDIFVAKYDVNGNFLSVMTLGGPGMEQGINMEIATNKDIILSGYFEDSVDLDPSASTNRHISKGGKDYFLARYNSNMNHLWSGSFGDSLWEDEIHMDLNSSGDIILGGLVRGEVDFDMGNGISLEGEHLKSNLFIASYSDIGSLQWVKTFGKGVNDNISSLKISATDEIIVTGRNNINSYFNPYTKGDTLPNVGSGDLFVASYRDSARLNWATTSGTHLQDRSACAVMGAGNYVYFGGSYQGYANINYYPTNDTIFGGNWGFNLAFAKYSSCYVRNETVSICNGDFYLLPDGDSVNSAGIYTTVFKVGSTCDSAIVTNLSIGSADTSVTKNFSSSLTANFANAQYYYWINCVTGDTMMSTDSTNHFQPDSNGLYKVVMLVNGCLFTSGCHQLNYVAVQDLSDRADLNLYPNPTNGILHLEFTSFRSGQIFLLDLYGKTILQTAMRNSGTHTLQLPWNMSNGLYVIRIESEEGTIVRKFEFRR